MRQRAAAPHPPHPPRHPEDPAEANWCCVREQVELKALQERLDIEKQHWEENYKKKEVCHVDRSNIYRVTTPRVQRRAGGLITGWGEGGAAMQAGLEFQVQLFQTPETNVRRK